MKHSARRFLYASLVPLAAWLLFVLLLHHMADPWWVRAEFDSWNLYQPVVDERRQKAMHLQYAPAPVVEDAALVVGTSRSTYYPADAFGGQPAFNFGLSALAVEDYDEVIRFYQKHRPQPERIYLMMDLLGVSKAEAARRVPFSRYEEELDTPFYRARLALSWDTFTNSVDVMKLNLSEKTKKRERTYYVGAREKHLNIAGDKERESLYQKYFKEEVPTRYGKEFQYRDDFAKLLRDIKEASAGTELVVIVTPVHDSLSKRVMEQGRYEDYARWLREMVAEFGTVYDAFSPTSFTAEVRNFRDSHHAYPDQCREIMKDVLAGGGASAVKVDAAMLPDHLAKAKKSWEEMSGQD
jgi:hypothetical protein